MAWGNEFSLEPFLYMLDLPYNYIEAKNEKELMKKLTQLSMKSGYTYKIISIYPRAKKVIAWYYASKRTWLIAQVDHY